MTDARLLVASLILLAAVTAPALAAESPYAPLRPLPLGSTLLTLPSNHVTVPHAWEMRFQHRFNGAADEGSLSDRIHTLFGLDSGANVVMGMAYVPRRDLEVALMRSNALDDVEVSAKYVVMQQASAIPFTLALRGGADWRTERNLRDRTSVFAQAIASRRFGARAEVFALPTWVTNAGRVATGSTSSALFSHAANVPLGIAFVVAPNMSLVGEWTPANRDLPEGMRGGYGWSVGIKHAIGGHHFEMMLSNSIATTVDQYTTTTFQGSPLRRNEIHVGFNIERQFGGLR